MSLLVASTASPCAPGDGARYDQALESAVGVVIVRVESVSLQELARDPIIAPYAVARVRVVTSLKGDARAELEVEFLADSCGGVQVDVGRYYLVVLPDLSGRVRVKSDDERIFSLQGEYSETISLSSPLVDSMKHFVKTGNLPRAELVREYYGRTRWPAERQ